MDFHVLIPARYHSTRLPGKLLMDLGGQSVIERVYRQSVEARPKSVVIATDHPELAEHAMSFGARVVMTSAAHHCGTDRLAEVLASGEYEADDIIVNVQGDEPFIQPVLISQVARIVASADVSVASLCWPIESQEQLHNPNVVKVVRDKNNNALYFSRSAIPANRDNPGSIRQAFRHIGLYAWRVSALLDYVRTPAPALEHCESLEQLRLLWEGQRIRVDVACTMPYQDINTEDDLIRARGMC
ncbi:3-deoxy-manno-octulosonate cytidylyltransferase [Legionella sp. CNM-4043-24]|uniref:3-deoxy-manno-octulosonate cytidylyltransferase n=1 Tax=Legionella sp. CNM-4043-24 TaxID=3421646 RepID=UPI00403B1ECB